MPVIQQERVCLRYLDMIATFDWPFGSDIVTITTSLGKPTQYSVQEAHDIFWDLLKGGAY